MPIKPRSLFLYSSIAGAAGQLGATSNYMALLKALACHWKVVRLWG